MPHLTLEALARLVDEAPTTTEREHLAECRACREELEALREQTDTLGALPKMAPPPDLWPELRTRLRDEGLVRRGKTRARISPALTRLAAGLALFLAGGAAGFAARGPVAEPTGQAVATAPAPEQADPTATDADAQRPGTLALDAGPGIGDVGAEVERTQEAFAAALDRYMMANSTEAPDPAARLAALDNIVLTTAEALNESPADPVINSYHLTAVAQRNELLRQIAASGDPVF